MTKTTTNKPNQTPSDLVVQVVQVIFFGSSQDQNSQETVDVTPTDLPRKSKGMDSKEEPKSLSHGNIHSSPQGSGCEGSPEPPSKSKGSPQ